MKTDAKGSAGRQGSPGCTPSAPTATQALKHFILGLLITLRLEIEERGKTLSATDAEVLGQILQRAAKEPPALASEKEERRFYTTLAREVAWEIANTAEANGIIDRLKSGDARYARDFFYPKSASGSNIYRFRSKIISQVRQSYGYEIGTEEFGNILYGHLWANGTWSALDSYAGKGSFFSWLESVAKHEVTRTLEEMGLINVVRERTAGNTRLLGPSVPPGVWYLILTETMPEGLHRDLLVAVKVDHTAEAQLAARYGLEPQALRDELRQAEKELKRLLIDSDGRFDTFVLRDKSPRAVTVSDEFTADLTKWLEDKTDTDPLADVFGTGPDSAALHDRVVEFLTGFYKQFHWNEESKLIWRSRFIDNVPTAQIAARLGRNSSWVHTRYFRLQQEFRAAIRQWWKNHR